MGSVAGLGVIGLLLLACIVSAAFWVVRRRRLDEAIRNSLGDHDPAVRLAAIEVLERQGAEHHVASLLWRSRVESDPSVRERLDRLVGPDDQALLTAGVGFRERRRRALHHIHSLTARPRS
jgi:HEAT repeat protein